MSENFWQLDDGTDVRHQSVDGITHKSPADIEREFIDLASGIGLVITKLDDSDNTVRVQVDGKKASNKSGSYIFTISAEGIGYGYAHNYTTGQSVNN